MSPSATVRVSNFAKLGEQAATKAHPNHWADAKASAFMNPWPSFRAPRASDVAQFLWQARRSPPIPKDLNAIISVRKPTWGLQDTSKLKATWLGHACVLVELPARSAAGASAPPRGARVLFDPVFSDRCSPSQWVGPKRITPTPCSLNEVPEVDAIVISHNHYDHLDTPTICSLLKRAPTAHIFAPLGNGLYFRSLGVPDSHLHLLDWWDSRRVEIDLPSGADESRKHDTEPIRFDITCTPAQHMTNRGVFDRAKSLWAGWVVEEVLPTIEGTEAPQTQQGLKVYFAGDTGYRTVREGQDENDVPTCPAFKEIGQRFGGIDFAMIPIGAYSPRSVLSPVHCAPEDSVRVFKDVRAKRAIGMHWGTWVLSLEHVGEPPKLLEEECSKAGIAPGNFTVCDIGETTFV